MTVDTWFETEFRDKYQQHADKLGRFNLAIFGKTGAGKSTLINAVFGEDVAATGIGEPVTMDGHLYLSSAGFLGLYDTRGLEIGNDTETIISELDELVTANKKNSVFEQIHAAWYCVRATDRRFESTEADFIRRLHELGLPVIVILTQVPSREGEHHAHSVALAEHIAGLGLPIDGGPILVMAEGDDFLGQVRHGLEDLLDATFRVVPEAVEAALAAAQQVDLDRKRKNATAAIAAAATAAAGIGAAPIPFADAALLGPLQLGMIASISAIYGVKVEKAAMAAALVPAIGASVGKAAVGGLLKFFPGVGSVMGGVINATTAAALTASMGAAWAAVCDQLAQGKLQGKGGLLDGEALSNLFNAEFLAQITKLLPTAKAAAK